MRPLLPMALLTPALLTVTPAFAQTATPTASTPTTSTPAPAAATLQLTAPVGSSVELLSTTTIQMSMDNMQVSAAPGSKVSTAKLNEARRNLGKPPAFPVQTITGKQFYKVTGRDAAGNVTLTTSTIQNLPATAQKTPPITSRITMNIAPSGKITITKMQSDNPQVNAVFAKLTPEALNKLGNQSGSAQMLYNVPLQVGQPQTSTATVDAQSLFGSLFSAVAGPQGQQFLSGTNISPITTTTTTTYRGLNAQGLHAFDTAISFQPWNMNINIPAEKGSPSMLMNTALLNTTASGQGLYRPDGLTAGGNMTQTMNMKMTITMDGIQTTMLMHMKMNMVMKPR